MSDPFVLVCLSNGLTIGGGVYYVAWDSGKDAAVIVVQTAFGDDPLEALEMMDLVDDDGEQLTFPSELKAHAFLL